MSARSIAKSVDPFLAPEVLESIGQVLDDRKELTSEAFASIVANATHGFNTDSTEPKVEVPASDFTE